MCNPVTLSYAGDGFYTPDRFNQTSRVNGEGKGSPWSSRSGVGLSAPCEVITTMTNKYQITNVVEEGDDTVGIPTRELGGTY